MTCKERLRGLACSLSGEQPHDVHVAIDGDGVLLGRWRMVPEELPLADAVPKTPGTLYDEVL
jgi:hypothetical protein